MHRNTLGNIYLKKKIIMFRKFIFFLSITFLVSCRPDSLSLVEVNDRFGSLPQEVIDPPDNFSTPEKIELGRLLFWDPILSGNKDVACATCHHPDFDYAEQLQLSIGVGGHGLSSHRSDGILVKRNSMTILNTAFNGIDASLIYDPSETVQFWDNRSQSLEEQALEPILSREEMRGDAFAEEVALDSIVARLMAIPSYRLKFEESFSNNEITADKIAKAIAAFERSLIANNSRFDQYVNGDETALTSKELKGMAAFTEGGCVACHNGPMFSDYELHVLGVPLNDQLTEVDDGAGNHEFRTASLRNLSNTGPYMHNGVFETLEDVLDFYDEFDNSSVSDSQRDPLLDDLEIPDRHEDDIIAFLKSLSDGDFDRKIPEAVPSGLKVGGNIE